MRKKQEPKQRLLPELRIEAPAMSAKEKTTWKEYARLLKTNAPQAELKAWARKHNVRLTGSNRVEFDRRHLGPQTSALTGDCEQICRVISYGGSTGFGRIDYYCHLADCEWSHEKRRWICNYVCRVSVVAPE